MSCGSADDPRTGGDGWDRWEGTSGKNGEPLQPTATARHSANENRPVMTPPRARPGFRTAAVAALLDIVRMPVRYVPRHAGTGPGDSASQLVYPSTSVFRDP